MSLLPFIVQVNIYLTLFYVFYVLLLRNETFFNLNRIYLISSSLLSFLIPTMQLPWVKSIFITEKIEETTTIIYSGATQIVYSVPAADSGLRTIDYLTLLYISGLIFLVGRLIFRLFLLATSPSSEHTAFSFFGLVKVSDSLQQRETILKHERVHVRQFHSADVLLFEIAAIFNWFNPIAWYYRKSIRFIHEYIADEEVTKEESKASYAFLLLSNAMGVQNQPLANSFFNESLLKRRIFMLNKTRSAAVGIWKYGLSAPLFILMLILSSLRMKAGNMEEIKESITRIPDLVTPGAPVKVTNVPAATNDFYRRNPMVKKVAYSDEVKGLIIYYKDGKIEKLSLETKKQRQDVEKRFGKLPSIFPPSIADKNSAIDAEKRELQDSVYDIENVDSKAEPIGGIAKFYESLGKSFKEASNGKNISGAVVVQFNVEKDGSISEIKVVKNIGKGLDETTIKELLQSSKWKPAMKDGKAVTTSYTLPIMLPKSDRTNSPTTQNDADPVYDFAAVNVQPSFPGGMEKFLNFIGQTYRMPEEAKAKDISGRVIVAFSIEKDGSLSDIKVLRSPGYGTAEEAIRTVKLSPKWNPALKDGKPVKVNYVLPIQVGNNSGKPINIKLKEPDYSNCYILQNGKQITAEQMKNISPKSMKKIEVIKDKAILRERGIDEKYEALILLTTE